LKENYHYPFPVKGKKKERKKKKGEGKSGQLEGQLFITNTQGGRGGGVTFALFGKAS